MKNFVLAYLIFALFCFIASPVKAEVADSYLFTISSLVYGSGTNQYQDKDPSEYDPAWITEMKYKGIVSKDGDGASFIFLRYDDYVSGQSIMDWSIRGTGGFFNDSTIHVSSPVERNPITKHVDFSVTAPDNDPNADTWTEFVGFMTGPNSPFIIYGHIPVLENTGGSEPSIDLAKFTLVNNGDTIIAATPEPASLVLFGLGMAGAGIVARRRNRTG